MKIKNQILKTMLVAFVAIVGFSCTNTNDNKEVVVPKKSILEIAKADTNFSILVAALKKTGLDAPGASPLSSAGSYTVFAPTNAAFAATPATATLTVDVINALDATIPADKKKIDDLKKILQNHVLGLGTVANDLLVAGYVKTFAPAVGTTTLSMFINKVGTDVLINGGNANGGAKVTSADILASNGIVHVIDGVLLLPTLVNHVKANPNFSTLLSVVTSGATGTYGDQSAVLDVLSKATANPVYNATTNTNPSLTVFAPVNDAFTIATKAATATTPAGFLTGTNATPTNITKILKYHVANGNTTTVTAGTSFATTDLTISTLALPQALRIIGSKLIINELPVVTTLPGSTIKLVNIQATNGVIHAIDRVLQPVL
jgi:uncharacterized surface protein with fasciclin (FAS1) repeats